MQKTILFDLDGTLSDTAIDLVAALNIFLGQKNIPAIPLEKARATAGQGGKALIEYGYASVGQESPDISKDIKEYLEIYEHAIGNMPTLFTGALDVLDYLESNAWVMGICSNKPEKLCHTLLDHLGIRSRFYTILGGDTLPVRKPDPEPIHTAIKKMNGKIEQTVLIGDTKIDRDACKNAGIDCILFSGGYAEHPVIEYNPEAVFNQFQDLPQILGDMYSHWN